MAAWLRGPCAGTSEEHGSRCPYKLRSLDEVALFLDDRLSLWLNAAAATAYLAVLALMIWKP
jgi:hypothetical protein